MEGFLIEHHAVLDFVLNAALKLEIACDSGYLEACEDGLGDLIGSCRGGGLASYSARKI
jgi:hypothetical protein